MALAADRDLKMYATQELIEIPVADNVLIYKGAFVGRDETTGYARPLVGGDIFLGVAYRQVDNTGPGHAAGAVSVVLHQDIDIVHAVTGASQLIVGAFLYASDDGTATLSSTGNSKMGVGVSFEGPGLMRVRCRTFTE
jgi:hypothetical protein